MREITVRSLTSGDWLNRDCLVTEVMQQGDYMTKVTRRCTYHVENRVTVPSTRETIVWAQSFDAHQPRQVYVTKEFDPELGAERVTYKVIGHFYVVQDQEIVCVGYRHVLSMAVDNPQPIE